MYNNYNSYYRERPTSKVYSLRKIGEIDQAYKIAYNLYNEDPDDEDARNAYAWTLIDLCKRAYKAGNIQEANEWLSKLSRLDFNAYISDFEETIIRQIKSLRLRLDPYYSQIQHASELSKKGDNNQAYEIMSGLADDGCLNVESHENYGWIIYRYLRDNIEGLDPVQIRSILRDYLQLQNERPSDLHSLILNFALNYSRIAPTFSLSEFFKLWGPDNLREKDFADSYGTDGNKIPSMMSRIAKAIANYPVAVINEFIDMLPIHKKEFIEMLQENYFWNIYNAITDKDFSNLWNLFDTYLSVFSKTGPSEWHSKILGLAEWVMKGENQYRFFNFLKTWNPENFRDSDWAEEKGNNGEIYRPLAIKALKKASDALDSLSEDSSGNFSWLIDAYDVAVRKFPDDDWTYREKALLLVKADRIEEAEEIYKDLVLRMGDKYYIWQEFANCVQDTNVKIGMQCKAISLEPNEDFIGKIRLELAALLMDAGMEANAVVEINLYKDNYAANGWSINPVADEMLSACSHIERTQKDNHSLYGKYIPVAEEYAYSGIPYTNLVLVDEWKNDKGKKFQKYVDGADTEITVNIQKFPVLKNSRKGQVWEFRLFQETTPQKVMPMLLLQPFHQQTVTTTYIPLTVKHTDAADWSILPEGYGYVDYVNEAKKIYHIYTQKSELVFKHYDRKSLSAGDYVKFRQYMKNVKDERKLFICCIRKCDDTEAISHFKQGIAAVDDVNEGKQLFHFVISPNMVSGIIHYSQTALRPSVGDMLRIHYCLTEGKRERNAVKGRKNVKVLKVEPTTEKNENIIREISGLLELKYRNDRYRNYYNDHTEKYADFAFIGNYYVHKSILVKYDITSDCQVRGKAVYSGNGKWKVYELEVIQ